jgi:amino acid transporter
MADTTMGSGAAARPGLFLRNATGLVKAWSTFDAFVYSFWSVNLITLGLYGMSYLYTVPDGQALAAILAFGVLTTFLVITYAMLVSVMPRTGGDYAWQSRVLGGGLGFVFSITGWWFTLFLWAPIYANILIVQFFEPLAYTLGWTNIATWFTTGNGVFVACLIVLAFVAIVVTLGMETYARIQKICFWIGLVGLAVVIVLLLVSSQSDFQNAFNREATSLFNAKANAYQGTIDAASKTFAGSDFSHFSLGPMFLLLPWLAFYLLWPNWGATLYGEVRGAKDIRKPFWSMFWGLWVTIALVAVVLLLMVKTMGWNFYQSANAAYWNNLFAVQGAPAPPIPIWPYPVMFAGFLVNSHLFQALLIIVMGLWFFGWAGTLFLSSTRVIFAAAFDRVLPSWAANISAKRRVPYGSLALMIVPSLVVSAVWAYKPAFQSIFLDATAVLAVTFLATVIAAIILPWRRKDLYDASPIANYKVLGIPTITVVAAITAVFLAFMIYEWSFNYPAFPLTGGNNNLYGTNLNLSNLTVSTASGSTLNSVYYFIATYVVAVAIYLIARVVRSRQGIDLRRIHHEIPVE